MVVLHLTMLKVSKFLTNLILARKFGFFQILLILFLVLDSIPVQNLHNGHDVLNKQLNHEKLMEHEQSGFMIFFFIVTLVCLCGFLIYLNKQKVTLKNNCFICS